MESRTLRRLWFIGLWFLFPWPLFVFANAWVPAARYVLLASAAGAVAWTEGAAGPVGLLVLLFVSWGIGTSLLCWLLAWIIAGVITTVTQKINTKIFPIIIPTDRTEVRAPIMAGAPERAALAITLGLLALGSFWAIFFEPYHTPFGRAFRGGLLQVLS